jgi:hypothetical protein
MHAKSFLSFLFLVGSLAGATRAIAAEAPSPPSATSDPVNVVRQVAKALTAGTGAIQDLRGPPIDHSNLDRLMLPTPGWIAALLDPSSMSHATALRSTKMKPSLCSPESWMMCRLPCRLIAGVRLTPYLTPI